MSIDDRMKNRMLLFLFLILFNQIFCLSGLNLLRYPVEVQSTNTFNVSSFTECLCICLNSINCSYFAYWSSISLSTCQFYTSSETKPDIINYFLSNNDTQTGLYIFINETQCQTSISSSSYNYNTNRSSYASLQGNRIISVLIMNISNNNRLLAIDANNASYYIFNLNTFQIIDNGTFLQPSGTPLCAQTFLNLLYIGYANNIIEVRQFNVIVNTSREEPQLLYSFSTSGGGPPQSLAILNANVLYYIVGPNILYVLLTQTNTSKQLYTFTSAVFASPSVVLVLDSINMELFLSDNAGTLFRIELSSINTNNGTSLISNSSIDQYQMPSNILTSLFIDQCNRLWALSAQAGSQLQMLVFIQQNNSSNKSFSTMNIINLTISLPVFIYSPYNFQLDDSYSLFTANAQQGVSAFFQL